MCRSVCAASQFTLDLTGKTSFCASIVATSEQYIKPPSGSSQPSVRPSARSLSLFVRPSFSQLFVTSSKPFKSHREGKIRGPRRDGDSGKREARNFARTFLRRSQRTRVTVRCFCDSAPALSLTGKKPNGFRGSLSRAQSQTSASPFSISA